MLDEQREVTKHARALQQRTAREVRKPPSCEKSSRQRTATGDVAGQPQGATSRPTRVYNCVSEWGPDGFAQAIRGACENGSKLIGRKSKAQGLQAVPVMDSGPDKEGERQNTKGSHPTSGEWG